MNQENISATIIAIEKVALEKLNKGNPSGYLEIYADNITYFDPFLEKKFDGLKEIKTFYDSLQGAIYVEKYEMIDPLSYRQGILFWVEYVLFCFKCLFLMCC